MSITAVLTLRNEATTLLEWLAHHRAIGIDQFLVFSNDCDDGTDAMLDRLAAMGWITHLRNDGPHAEGPQWAALKAADRHPLVRKADWLITFDIDEFINIKVGRGTLDDLFAAAPQADAFVMTWRMFGNGGVIEDQPRPLTETFTKAAPAVLHWPWRAQMVKTLYRQGRGFDRLGVHRPRARKDAPPPEGLWLDGSGHPLPETFKAGRLFTDLGRDSTQWVQMNHYALGSMQGFLLKVARGRANRKGGGFDLAYWVERNFNAVEDLSIQRLSPLSAPLLAELRADPLLAQLEAAARAWRHARLKALLQQPDWQGFYGQLLLAGPSRILPATFARQIWDHPTHD